MRASYAVHEIGAADFCYKIFIAGLLCDVVSFNSCGASSRRDEESGESEIL